jgi:hypothetical protein
MAISALRRLCVPFLVAAATIAVVAISSGGSQAQWVKDSPQFQPIFDVKLCNDLDSTFSGPSELQGGSGTCAPDTTGGSNPDITSTFTVPYGSMTLGVGTNLCGGDPLIPQFIWWDAETSLTDTEPCQAEGTSDRWSNFADDGGDGFTGQADADSLGVTKYPECTMALFDPDGDGIDTDGDPLTVGDQPVQPNWRGIGLTQVSGDWQMLQNIEFAPGALAEAFLANPGTTHHPYAKLHKNLGYTNIVQLNDPTSVILQPNPISDFCSELGTRGMIKGQVDTNGAAAGGVVDRITSSSDGGSSFAQSRTMSYRDADGDGIENNFDTCPWQSNTASEDPYTSTGPDEDMLDSVCDPFPLAKTDDQDSDAYENPQDYCPQVTNSLPGGETDDENNQAYNDSAPDGGPRQDSIGDDCDGSGVVAGNPAGKGDTDVSDGLFFNAIHTDSVCIEEDGRVDNDEDGWCDDIDPADADTYNAAAAEDGDAAQCGDGLDDGKEDLSRITPADGADRWDIDCNANLGNPGQMTHTPMDRTGVFFSATLDSDGDGYDNLLEWFLTTDPSNKCPLHPKPATDPAGPHDAWPPDMDNSGTANLLDLLVFKKAFNTEAVTINDVEDGGGPGSCNDGEDNGPSDDGLGTDGADLSDDNNCYKVRVDLNPTGAGTADKVNLLDLLPFKSDFNDPC